MKTGNLVLWQMLSDLFYEWKWLHVQNVCCKTVTLTSINDDNVREDKTTEMNVEMVEAISKVSNFMSK